MATTLNQLMPGQKGTITKIGGSGSIKQRLIDMGVVPGTSVEMQKYAPLGDPLELKIKGFNLSLRKAEAELIEIEIN